MRYQEIGIENLKPGMNVRITSAFAHTAATEVYQGPVVRVTRRTGGRGLIGGAPLPDVVDGIVIPGEQFLALYPVTRWHIIKVELALPPLPRTLGSVVLHPSGRTAVLRGQVDEPDGVWVWSDTGEETGPVLDSAEIIHAARP